MVFSHYEHLKHPTDANFYNALLTASVKTTQDMFFRVPAPRLDVPVPEDSLEFDDFSVWLIYENVSKQLNYGILLLTFKTLGIFLEERRMNKCVFEVQSIATRETIVIASWIAVLSLREKTALCLNGPRMNGKSYRISISNLLPTVVFTIIHHHRLLSNTVLNAFSFEVQDCCNASHRSKMHGMAQIGFFSSCHRAN